MKAACFVGTAREDLAAFPESARRRAGYELFMVQVGREPADFKPIPTVGPGAYEIRVGTFHHARLSAGLSPQADGRA